MKFYNLCFLLALALSTSTQLCSMNSQDNNPPTYRFEQFDTKHNPMSFELHSKTQNSSENLHIGFNHILLPDLDEPTHKEVRTALTEHVGDFDAIESMLGAPIAYALKALHTFSADAVLKMYLNNLARKYRQMPEGRKTLHFWAIKDYSKPVYESKSIYGQLIGKMTVSTYIDPVPAEYEDKHLLEIALTLTPEYRKRGGTSMLAAEICKFLYTLEPFQKGTFCFSTRSDNEAIHKIAKKINAGLILQYDRLLDFGIINGFDFLSYTIPSDLFIIPR